MSSYWWAKSAKQILEQHMGIEDPSFELLKWIDGYIDNCIVKVDSNPTLDVWYFIYGFTDKQIMFLVNNFADKLSFDQKWFYMDFFERLKDLPNQKEIALKYIETGDLDQAIELCKKEEFDLTLLDFLDGKIAEEKLVNWGVGQVMKQYPKRFSPAEVNAAIRKRFL